MCPKLYDICNKLNITVENALKNQLCSNIEIKLRKFNFKILYGILPCNVNLQRWRKKDTDVCDICHSRQTIEHLLFSCHRAQHLWQLVKDTFDINVSFSSLICGFQNIDNQLSGTITLLSFLLYKEWLLPSLDNKQRSIAFPYHFYICELKLRAKIYSYGNNNSSLCVDSITRCLESKAM